MLIGALVLFCVFIGALVMFCACNIPAAPAYEVYISQLIRYSRACGSYQEFLDRGFAANRKTTETRVPLG